jgi:hypothetical protein
VIGVIPTPVRAPLPMLVSLGARSRYPHARLLTERINALAEELQSVLDLEYEEARYDREIRAAKAALPSSS